MFTAFDAEPKLGEMVASIADNASRFRAVEFRLSHMLEHYRSTYQIQIAVNLIKDLMKDHEGGIFVCRNSDIFVIVEGAKKALLDKLIFQLRYLFMDDPLSYHADGQENAEFCEIFDLSVHYPQFAKDVQRRVMQAAKQRRDDGGQGEGAPGRATLKEFNPQALAIIEADLRKTDIARVIRRQPICAALPNTNIRRVFDELYINIAHLRQLLRSDADLLSNRWLFKYLTQLLDFRMLDMLTRHKQRFLGTPISINVNIETILTDEFTQFDAAITNAEKVAIVLEIHVADVFNDMAAFRAAREHAQKLGYRVCLDGLTELSFLQIDRARLGFDLAKLQWNADFDTDMKTEDNHELYSAVRRCGANRIILCRCDNRKAIDFGQALGISLFQGRYLDRVLDPTSTVEN